MSTSSNVSKNDHVDIRECPHCGSPVLPSERVCPVCGQLIDLRSSSSSLLEELSQFRHDAWPSTQSLLLFLLFSFFSIPIAWSTLALWYKLVFLYLLLTFASVLGDPSSVQRTREYYRSLTNVRQKDLLFIALTTTILSDLFLSFLFLALPFALSSLFSFPLPLDSWFLLLPGLLLLAFFYGITRISSILASLMGLPPFSALLQGLSYLLNSKVGTLLLSIFSFFLLAMGLQFLSSFPLVLLFPLVLWIFLLVERGLLFNSVILTSLRSALSSLPPVVPIDGLGDTVVKTCPRCGIQIQGQARYCVMCGYDLRAELTAATTRSKERAT